ncbi:Nif3-like dinuclear metal center hexameric protein [Gordonia jinhuaensis]|uniref:GTP cyclohydrolase 1 type 2 homolog n=1 Tax=Gordonia jinhuaensis TaxID=1517702 RepID=A0A916WNW5_9ACTN|nr:Nif3-like dinuclear metal center hexameric protein [Gordonia jinhuaensis]GGB18539.1 GTP cyclohydrolase 1 type 2 [Gordonia jinhuaensis]
MPSVTVADVIAVLDRAYPPVLAQSWDSVGLVCGDPAESAESILLTVDVTDEVVDAAVADGHTMIVAHHPLLLRGVDRVGTDTAKGRIVHRLIRHGIALFTAHTNADSAQRGVSDALADALGLVDCDVLEPTPTGVMDKWSVFVPAEDADTVAEAMFAAGAGEIGEYRHCDWRVDGRGQFLPVGAAQPAIGAVGELAAVAETKIEMVARAGVRERVLEALRRAHPYEEPAFDVLTQASLPGATGLGRIGRLAEPMSLAQFTAHVAATLPATPWGVRAAGDPQSRIEKVAVCGGAGDSLLDLVARTDADAYVTGDLRHHPVDEHRRAGGPALVDAGHWATEFPWCADASATLTAALPAGVAVAVHQRPTDPFVVHADSPPA